MSQVEILQPPHAATGGRQPPHQRHEPPSGSGNFEQSPESLRGGFAEQRAAPLDGFVRQPSALLDHLVPAREREMGGEGALAAAGEDGAPMCERLCVLQARHLQRRQTAEGGSMHPSGSGAQALLAFYALGLQHMLDVPGLGRVHLVTKCPSWRALPC